MHGDPLAMFAYGIEVLPLIKRLKSEYPDIAQTWYSEGVDALGTLNTIGLYFNSVKIIVLGRGYSPEHPKKNLIMLPDNLTSRKEFGLCHEFNVCTGMYYLGGFIGNDKSKCDWLKDLTTKREKKIVQSPKQWGKSPGELRCGGLCNTIIMDIFATCEKDTGYTFMGVWKILWENFMSRLFFGKYKALPLIVGTLSTMTAPKQMA